MDLEMKTELMILSRSGLLLTDRNNFKATGYKKREYNFQGAISRI